MQQEAGLLGAAIPGCVGGVPLPLLDTGVTVRNHVYSGSGGRQFGRSTVQRQHSYRATERCDPGLQSAHHLGRCPDGDVGIHRECQMAAWEVPIENPMATLTLRM